MRGFVMTEVLVALLLLTLAVTAVLALALGGFAATAEARRAEIAAGLAADLAGRTRATAGVDWTSLPAPHACGVACTPEQLAALELADWQAAVAVKLPDGSAVLEPAGGGGLVITLGWAESGHPQRQLRMGIGR